jgi:hypothetical protein
MLTYRCSKWSIVVAAGELTQGGAAIGTSNAGTLEGEISAGVHYFEDGNVHMKARYSVYLLYWYKSTNTDMLTRLSGAPTLRL